MNLLSSIVKYKCPSCRKGDIYTKPFKMSAPLSMVETCPHCGQKTNPEPGFYYGAMFVSYVFTAFLYLGIIGFLILVLGWNINEAFGLLLLFVALTYFKTARLSRSLWLHLMVKYKNKPTVL